MPYRDQLPFPNKDFGLHVNTLIAPLLTAAHWTEIADAGFKYVRTGRPWSFIEVEQGAFDWTYFDTLMERATAAGLRVVILLAYNNQRYYIPPDQEPPPGQAFPDCLRLLRNEYRVAYCEYVRLAVQRYQGSGILWEIYNEPNHSWFWWPTGADALAAPNEFRPVLVAARDAIRAVYEPEWILGGAFAPKEGTNDLDRVWIQNLHFGIGQPGQPPIPPWPVDSISYHPYRPVSPYDPSYADDFNWLKNTISPKPLVSEMGYDTNVISQQQQAAWLVDLIHRSRELEVPLTVLFQYRDDVQQSPGTNKAYGLRFANNSPKPAWEAVKNAINQ